MAAIAAFVGTAVLAIALTRAPANSGASQRGHASLSVQAIQARPGIPGHSMTP